ncbi:DUF2628 domain-containing protein [Rhodoblastus sp.]|uniref:DUF2628 domain-containing protein n=1 Tax=Rhodoblastus sp. TaxID=1962975 RepID=UPI0035B2BC85
MNLYSVYLPTGVSQARSLERATFVKSGFSKPAFLITPVWALRHRLWLAFGLWVALLVVVSLLAVFARIGTEAAILLYWLGAAAFGLEADRFRQAGLDRRGFLMHGLALGASTDDAETVYFARRADAPADAAPAPVSPRDGGAKPPAPPIGQETDFLGLFPTRESKP